jgi:hypothetical protein
MKTQLLIVMMLIGLVSCSNKPSTPSAKNDVVQAKAEIQESKIPYSIASTYIKAGRTWKMIVVKPPITDGQLVGLAKHLHQAFPNDAMLIFDNDSRLKAYENWTKNYPNPAYPYPEVWVQKHHLGTINRMLAPGGATWQLLGGSAHPKSPESKIADLE